MKQLALAFATLCFAAAPSRFVTANDASATSLAFATLCFAAAPSLGAIASRRRGP